MSESENGAYRVLADALYYPFPGLLASLEAGAPTIPQGPGRKAFQSFIEAVRGLTLEEWEELYTRTLDLSPAVAPYLGYQLWGDGYPRGVFMAALNRAYLAAGLEVDGELPDHLGVVLNFLDTGAPPPPELVEAFEPAINKMLATLQKSEAGNPYTDLLEAAAKTVNLKPVEFAAS